MQITKIHFAENNLSGARQLDMRTFYALHIHHKDGSNLRHLALG
jgi:hypothetical protein